MNKLLQSQLYNKYPKIFIYKNEPGQCMFRGIECGDGWYHILNTLCEQIQSYIDNNTSMMTAYMNRPKSIEQVKFIQVKEKFGGLRIYIEGGDANIQFLINFIGQLSYKICENCGIMNETIGHVQKGWIQTLCLKCAMEYGKKIKQEKKSVKLWEKVVKSRKVKSRSWPSLTDWTMGDFMPFNLKKKK